MAGYFEIKDKVDALEILLDNLSQKDQNFAASLIDKARVYKGLSDKQLYWVGVLSNKAMGLDENGKPFAPAPTVEVGNFAKVIELFNKAKKVLKFPKVAMQAAGYKMVLSMAGPKSKAPGTINVTDGKPFGENVWYGRVNVDGTMTQGKAPSEAMQVVVSHLQKFGEDPHGVAQEYGQVSGCCCFCSRPLTDAKSVTVGYGPVCAEKWGLKPMWNKALKGE